MRTRASLRPNITAPSLLRAPFDGVARSLSSAPSRPLAQSLAALSGTREPRPVSSLDAPPLVTDVSYGVVGGSRFATQLRREMREARKGSQHVLVRGEPGCHKDWLATLIHFGGRRGPLARLECPTLKAWKLFGLEDAAADTVNR